jgi:hypothetical protein
MAILVHDVCGFVLCLTKWPDIDFLSNWGINCGGRKGVIIKGMG